MVPIISIVDDDPSVRAATAGLVRSFGYVAQSFSSAEEFLSSSDIKSTSCLITDVQMPGMSGLDLQEALLAQGRRIPVIFITAFPEKRIRDRAQANGALAYLEKPFEGETMARCLTAALKA